MKRNSSKTALLTLFALTGKCFAQTVTTGSPGVVYQNPAIYPTATPVYVQTTTPTYSTAAPGYTTTTPTYMTATPAYTSATPTYTTTVTPTLPVTTPTYSTVTPTYISSPSPYVQNSTYPSTINYSASLPGTPVSPLNYGTLPGTPYFNPNNPTASYIPPQYNPNVATPNNPNPTGVLQQIYPQPANPNVSAVQGIPPGQAAPLQLSLVPFEYVSPPQSYQAGLATIKDRQWVVSDFLYNLVPSISVQVEIVKPSAQYIPISQELLEKRIEDIFQNTNINTAPDPVDCRPPLPMFYVIVMAYSCGRHCVGVVIAQLYEDAKPKRIDVDLNGVWQTITWERQAMVVSACEDFSVQMDEAIDEITQKFADRFTYYHPIPERPCYPPVQTQDEIDEYNRYFNPDYRCGCR